MVEWTWQEPVLCKNGQCISYGIEYSLAAGTVFWGQTSLTTGRWASLHIGSPIQAWYVSGDPDRNELSHGSAFWVALYAVLLGLALVGLGAGGFLVVMIRVGRMIAVRETGERREAKVTWMEEGFRSNFLVESWTVHWRDDAGQTGASLPLMGCFRSVRPLPAGFTITITTTIYADASGKLPPVWEGDCGARDLS